MLLVAGAVSAGRGETTGGGGAPRGTAQDGATGRGAG